MSDLDKKLKTFVLNTYASSLLKDSVAAAAYKVQYGNGVISPKEHDDLMESVDGFVLAIKQAFIDDGWFKQTIPNHAEGDVVAPLVEGYMTKEEWEAQAIKDGGAKTNSDKCHHDWREFRDGNGHFGEKCLYCFDFRHMSALDAEECPPSVSDGTLWPLLWVKSNGYMTGQEWYDRFEKELIVLSKNIYKVDDNDPHFWNYYVNNGDAVEAAKKAAGIE